MAPLEIHASKTIGLIFIVFSGTVMIGLCGIAIYLADSGPLGCALWFSLGLAVGLRGYLQPPILLILDESGVTLFTGSLWGNAPGMLIARKVLRSLSAESDSTADGPNSSLRLVTANRQDFPDQTPRWARSYKSNSRFRAEPENVVIWPLQQTSSSRAELNEVFGNYLSAGAGEGSGDLVEIGHVSNDLVVNQMKGASVKHHE